MTQNNLKSFVTRKGKVVDEIIQFSNGNKKTFRGVKTETIEQSEFTHFELENGHLIGVNPVNVDWFEVIPEKKDNE